MAIIHPHEHIKAEPQLIIRNITGLMHNIPTLPDEIFNNLPRTLSSLDSNITIISTEENKAIFDMRFNNNNYIIKVVTNDDVDEVRNEVLVSQELMTLNSSLRDNFSRLLYYDIRKGFNYPAIKIFPNHNCDIIVYEKIPGVTLSDYIKYCDIDTMKKVLAQIFNTLYDAYLAIGFTHYDLHSFNIIITPENKAVIIDYGSSYVSTNKNSGRQLNIGSIAPTTWWFHDVFKILAHLHMATDIDKIFININAPLRNLKYKIGLSYVEVDGKATAYYDTNKILQTIYYYNFSSEFYNNYKNNSSPSQSDNKMVIIKLYNDILPIVKIEADREITIAKSRTNLYKEIHNFINDVLEYFQYAEPHTKKTISNPEIYMAKINKLHRYFAFTPEEVKGGSFKGFMEYFETVINS